MAITDSTTKSILMLMAIAVVGAIFIVATALLRNRTDEPTFTTKPYAEPESGVVFDAPLDWTVGTGANAFLQARGVRLEKISSQRGGCSNVSPSLSSDLEQALAKDSSEASTRWAKQFPGLQYRAVLTSQGGDPVLIGVDTCSASLNRNTLTFRGQMYRNDVEVRFTVELVVDEELAQSALDKVARSLGVGSAELHQEEFTAFRSVLQSVR